MEHDMPGRASMLPCIIAAVVCIVACSVSSGFFFLSSAASLIRKVKGIAASARGKHYDQVVAEVHAVAPGGPIYVVRQGTGQMVAGNSTALIIAVDAKGKVVDFPEDWSAGYAHGGVVGTFGDFGQV